MTDNLLYSKKSQIFLSGSLLPDSHPLLQDFAQSRSDLSGVASVNSEGEARRGSLLYLNSNISTENNPKKVLESLCGLLSPYSQKVAYSLTLNVEKIVNAGIERVGFMTLTFKENITCPKEASKRFNSFNSHFLSKYPDILQWVAVRERQKRGAWHYHLLVLLPHDIRTGFDWQLYEFALKIRNPTFPYRSPKNKNYRQCMREALKTSSPQLRKYWKDLREACSKYGFGRSEMLPVKTNTEAMSKYIGKYISKELGQRESQDKGVRLINYSQGWIKNSSNFQWNTDGSKEWRRKLRLFARLFGCDELYNLNKKLGPSWAYHFLDDIIKIDEFIERTGKDPEKVKIEEIPNHLIIKMEKHQNIREAKKVRKCPLCERKGVRQWQDHSLYCVHCGGLIF